MKESYSQAIIEELKQLLSDLADLRREVKSATEQTDRIKRDITDIRINISHVTLDGVEITVKERGGTE